jgi:phosphate/sulfate permease
VASNIFLAWLVTLPATAAMAALIYLLINTI